MAYGRTRKYTKALWDTKVWRGRSTTEYTEVTERFRVRLRRFWCPFVFSPAGIWDGLRPNTKVHESPSGHERCGGVAQPRNTRKTRKGLSCPPEAALVVFRVQPRREPQGTSVFFSVPRSGFQCVQWQNTLGAECGFTTEHTETAYRPTQKFTEYSVCSVVKNDCW